MSIFNPKVKSRIWRKFPIFAMAILVSSSLIILSYFLKLMNLRKNFTHAEQSTNRIPSSAFFPYFHPQKPFSIKYKHLSQAQNSKNTRNRSNWSKLNSTPGHIVKKSFALQHHSCDTHAFHRSIKPMNDLSTTLMLVISVLTSRDLKMTELFGTANLSSHDSPKCQLILWD